MWRCGTGRTPALSTPTTDTVLWRRRADCRRWKYGATIGTSAEHRGRVQIDDCADGGEQLVTRVRPTAIYANPVLLDLIDREMKTEFNVVLNTKEISAGLYGEDAFDPGGRYSVDS